MKFSPAIKIISIKIFNSNSGEGKSAFQLMLNLLESNINRSNLIKRFSSFQYKKNRRYIRSERRRRASEKGNDIFFKGRIPKPIEISQPFSYTNLIRIKADLAMR
jgi:hypothetical protein